MNLDDLRDKEFILSGSYWENFKYEKDIAQMYGGTHPRVKRINDGLKKIQAELHEVQREIKKMEEISEND